MNEFFSENGVNNYSSTPYLHGRMVYHKHWLNHTWRGEYGRIRTWSLILVQCNTEWCDLKECNIQGACSHRVGTTQNEKSYGVKTFWLLHLNKDRKEKGRHAPKAVEAINLGFTTDCNTSGYKLLIEGTNKIVISNQVKFDENLYPYRNHNMVEQNLSDIAELDIITTNGSSLHLISI